MVYPREVEKVYDININNFPNMTSALPKIYAESQRCMEDAVREFAQDMFGMNVPKFPSKHYMKKLRRKIRACGYTITVDTKTETIVGGQSLKMVVSLVKVDNHVDKS